jgi:hypothetical protein
MVAMGKEQTGIRVPSLLVKAAIKLVQQSVLKRSGLDLNKLKPIEHVDKCGPHVVWSASGFRLSCGTCAVVVIPSGRSSQHCFVTVKMTTSLVSTTAGKCAWFTVVCAARVA